MAARVGLQEAERCPLSGAVSLCNPFDLVIADEDFHKGFNNIYDKSLARGLRKIFSKWVASTLSASCIL
jgi:predicted alpha/beta-fold hydrolase